LIARFAQAAGKPDELRLSVYVDDPVCAVVGTKAQRQLTIARTVFTWLLMGFRMQFSKSQLGQSGTPVTWTSTIFTVGRDQVEARIKDEILDNIRSQLKAWEFANLSSVKDMRSFIGRCVCVCTLLFAWRPFVAMLWAPLCKGAAPQSALPGCLWRKQVDTPLRWISAFLASQEGSLTRLFKLEYYLAGADEVDMTMDASPWGMGAYLTVNGIIIQWFESRITQHDVEVLGHDIGGCEGQQTWDALVAFVSLRQWRAVWLTRRATIKVRSDRSRP
jgi:hypothetical protein